MAESNIWVEKYRPSKLADIPVRSDIIEDLKGFVKRGSLPHMIFAGSQGGGKTMTTLALAEELYGEDYGRYFLKISCSDEGVMVRRKPLPGEGGGEIQEAKRRRRGARSNKRLRLRKEILDHIKSPPMGEVPHKILYLLDFDEEDSQTQNALRRPMEKHSDNCRFILAVENVSNIIEPLISRCTMIRFGRPSEDKSERILREIEKNESIELTEDGFKAIMNITRGDIPHAINLLQSASTQKNKIDEDLVYRAYGSSRTKGVVEMVDKAFGGDFKGARKKLLNLLIDKGVEPEDLLGQIQKEVLNLKAPDPVKIKLVEKMGNYDFDLKQSANERIHLESALTHIARIGERLKS